MKNVVLIGMMGSGKTSVGKILSTKLGFKLIDTDYEVEKKNKMTINELFDKFGEKAFRHLEEEVVQELGRVINRVISTGGGTVLNPGNFNLLKRNSDIIYLKTSPNELYKRIKHEKNRPLLKTEDPQLKIEKLIEERKEVYEKACFTVDTDGKTTIEVANEILEKLGSDEI